MDFYLIQFSSIHCNVSEDYPAILVKLRIFFFGNLKISYLASSGKFVPIIVARSNAGIVGSNHTRGMDVCVRLFCAC
jgi:hypothetical protein